MIFKNKNKWIIKIIAGLSIFSAISVPLLLTNSFQQDSKVNNKNNKNSNQKTKNISENKQARFQLPLDGNFTLGNLNGVNIVDKNNNSVSIFIKDNDQNRIACSNKYICTPINGETGGVGLININTGIVDYVIPDIAYVSTILYDFVNKWFLVLSGTSDNNCKLMVTAINEDKINESTRSFAPYNIRPRSDQWGAKTVYDYKMIHAGGNLNKFIIYPKWPDFGLPYSTNDRPALCYYEIDSMPGNKLSGFNVKSVTYDNSGNHWPWLDSSNHVLLSSNSFISSWVTIYNNYNLISVVIITTLSKNSSTKQYIVIKDDHLANVNSLYNNFGNANLDETYASELRQSNTTGIAWVSTKNNNNINFLLLDNCYAKSNINSRGWKYYMSPRLIMFELTNNMPNYFVNVNKTNYIVLDNGPFNDVASNLYSDKQDIDFMSNSIISNYYSPEKNAYLYAAYFNGLHNKSVKINFNGIDCDNLITSNKFNSSNWHTSFENVNYNSGYSSGAIGIPQETNLPRVVVPTQSENLIINFFNAQSQYVALNLQGYYAFTSNTITTLYNLQNQQNIAASEITNQKLLELLQAEKNNFYKEILTRYNSSAKRITGARILPLNSQNQDDLRKGKLQADISFDGYYEPMTNNTLCSSRYIEKTITCTISGFKQINDTTAQTSIDLDNVSNIVGQYFYINTYTSIINDVSTKIKQYLVNNQATFFSNLNGSISENDLEITTANNPDWNFDNLNGWIKINIKVINNKAIENGIVVASKVFENIKVNGFKHQEHTKIPLVDSLDVSREFANKFTNQVSQQEILNYLNQPNIFNQLVADAPIDTKLIIKDGSFNNTNEIKQGIITLSIDVNKYFNYSRNSYLEDPNYNPHYFQITLTGFRSITNPNDKPLFTTNIPNQITINANDIVAQFYTQNLYDTNISQINDLIKTTLASQISNLNPNIIAPNIKESIAINRINDFNNIEGWITISASLNNDLYWENGNVQQSHDFSLKVLGFKHQQPTSWICSGNQVDGSQDFKSILSTDVNETQLNDFLNKQEIKSQLFSNLLPDSKIIIETGSIDKNTLVSQGKVTLRVATNKYFDANNNSNLVNSNSTYYNLTIYGFKSAGDDPLSFTTIIQNGQLNNVNNILASKVFNNQLSPNEINQILQAICDANVIKNSVIGQTITVDDLMISQVIEANNKTGTILCKITIKNSKAWIKGVVQPTWISNIVEFSGFKTQLPTTTGSNRINIADWHQGWEEKLAIEFTSNDAITFINEQSIKNAIYINLPSDANIQIIGELNKTNASLGEIELSVNVTKYFNDTNAFDTNGPMANNFNITIFGFKNGHGQTTNFSGTINCNLSNYFYSDVSTNKKQAMIDIIVNELVTNQSRYFKNLVPGTTLTASDISITIDETNIDNTTGQLIINNITIINNKAMQNGEIKSNFIVSTNAIVTGLNTQLPSEWLNTTSTSIVLNGASDFYVQEMVSNPNKLCELINNNKQTILANPVNNTTLKILDDIEINIANNDNTVSVTVYVDKYYNNKGIETNNSNQIFKHRYIFSGFNKWTDNLNTSWLLTTINWNSNDFKSIFGQDNNGYSCDWAKSDFLNKYKQNFISYVNNPINQSKLFNNPNNTRIVGDVISSSIADNIITFNFNVSGIKNGLQVDNIACQITINLRSTPGQEGSSDTNPETNPLAGFQQYLQAQVDANNGELFNDNELKQKAADYLNQTNIKEQLPSSCIPINGSFNANDINLDTSKINKNSNPIIFDKGAFTTKTNPVMFFPALSINIAITSINSPIQATNPIASYNASEIINIWQNNNRNDPKIIAITTWINDSANKQRIFNHLPANAQVNEITNITSGLNDNNSLNISVKLSQAYTNNGLENDVIFNDLIITGFNSSFTATTLKINSLRYDETLFKTIFGVDDKGFVSDWQHSIATKQEQLHQNIVNNLSNWFNTTANTNINVSPINIEITPSNEAIATFTYSGFNQNGQFVNDLKGQITIFLRSNPDFNNPNDVNNPLKDFNQWLQNKIDSQPSPNNGVWPSDNILKQWISDYLNTKKDQLPNVYIPSSGSFNSSDITIDPTKINKTKNPIILEPGAVSTTNTQENLLLPQANITVKETTLKNPPNHIFPIGSDLTNLRIADIIYDFQTNGTNGTLVIKIQTWINNNLINIFNNLVQPTPSATINNITTSSSGDLSAIDVSITLSEAYTTNGIAPKEFSFTLTGFNNSVQNDTTLKITQINYNDSLFGEIFTNKQIFAIDWACLTSVQIQQKCSELSSYMSSHLDVFFNNPNTNEPANIVINEQGIDFSNITNNIIVVNITFNGYKNNIAVSNISGSITINLKSINDVSNDIFPSINDALTTVIQSSNKLPTQDEINKIVIATINKNPDLLNKIPDAYLNNEGLLDSGMITIDPSKITSNGNKVTIEPGLIALKPNPDKIANLNPHWPPEKVNNILIPEHQSYITNLDLLVTNNNSDWWIWVVIAAGIAIGITLLILLVIYILKSRKDTNECLDI